MADNVGFRNMFADPVFGLNAESSRELVDVNGVNSMPRLADLTDSRVGDLVSLIRKTVVRGAGRAANRRMTFPEIVVDLLGTDRSASRQELPEGGSCHHSSGHDPPFCGCRPPPNAQGPEELGGQLRQLHGGILLRAFK